MTMFIEDGQHPQWQFHKDYPWNEYKHLKRDKFEELVDLMIEAHPDPTNRVVATWVLYE